VTDVLQQEKPSRRLESELIAWLTTVGADGQPQSSPIWFIWDGSTLWLRSQATAGKIRNVQANPKVAFHLADDHGGEIITIEGTATLEPEPGDLFEKYLAKYEVPIRDELKMTPEDLAAGYPTTIRITPTRTRAW